MKYILRTLIIIIVAFYSCKDGPCKVSDITPVFVGFAPSDLDTIIVRKFNKGDNFTHLIDTIIFVKKQDTSRYNNYADTTIVILNKYSDNNYTYLIPNYDWQIFLPTKNMTIFISDIESPQTHYKPLADGVCWNPINSFVQNGQTVYPKVYSHQLNYFYFNDYAFFINN